MIRRFLRAALPLSALAVTAAELRSQSVVFERQGARLAYIGAKVTPVVRVLGEDGQPVSNATIRFRSIDPAIATVTRTGEISAQRNGLTRVWAVVGRDSASFIVSVEQRVARFAFSPSMLRLDALSATVPLRIQVSDSAGSAVADASTKVSACKSLNNRIATYSPSAGVTAVANGFTYIRCADLGIADSIRVDVRQRPVRVTITDKAALGQRVAGDTFSVRVTAVDRSTQPISDARPTWASLNPTSVAVDPLTGKARAVEEGVARVVVQLGDVADTVGIRVAAGPGGFGRPQTIVAPVDSTPAALAAAPTRLPLIEIAPFPFLSEGDSGRLVVTIRDTNGNTLTNQRVRIRSADQEIISTRDSVVRGKKRGSAFVIAESGDLRDSILISVGLKATTLTDTSVVPFVQPAIDTIRSNRARYVRDRDTVLANMLATSEFGKPSSGRSISLSATAAMVEQGSRTSATLVEKRTGLLIGGMAAVAPHRLLLLSGGMRRGDLTPDSTLGEVLTVTEAEANITFLPIPSLGFRGGYVIRSERTEIAGQIWKYPRASIVTRFDFVGDLLSTIADFSILPKASYSGTSTAEPPSSFSMAGEAGLEVHTGAFVASLSYYVERFNFDTSPRVEQFSALRFRVGLKLGK